MFLPKIKWSIVKDDHMIGYSVLPIDLESKLNSVTILNVKKKTVWFLF